MTIARSIGRTARPVANAGETGRSSPLGATVVEGGVNFSLFSRTASGAELLFFDREDDDAPSRVIRIDPATNRTYHYWHVFVPDDSAVGRLRNRQVKNHLALTPLSLGVPMILMGDEARRTQRGNNNDYFHDDPSTWFDWALVEAHADVHRFVSLLAAKRSLRDAEHERQRVSLNAFLERANKAWHGVRLFEPDWGDGSHSIAVGAEVRREGLFFHLIMNAYWGPLEFELPAVGDGARWQRWIDTALDSPHDIVPWQMAPAVPGNAYRVGARSVAMLFAESRPGAGGAAESSWVIANVLRSGEVPSRHRSAGR